MRTTATWALLAFFLLTTSAAHAEGRKLAVVVGVDAYRANSGLPRLRYAGRDATELSRVLRDNGYSVTEMTHRKGAQRGNETLVPIADYLLDHIQGVLDYPNLGPDDSIIVSLHGHGVQFDQTDSQGKSQPKFFFCPADAMISGVESANELTGRNHLLPLEALYKRLGACRAGVKLLIVDACRNDPSRPSAARSGLESVTLPKLPPPPGGTAAFFVCKPNQRSIEDSQLRHGVFTHFLIEGLRGSADRAFASGRPADGIVTLSELSAYVAGNTYDHVYQKYRVKQSPELRGDFDLNLPIGRVVRRVPPPRVEAPKRDSVVEAKRQDKPERTEKEPSAYRFAAPSRTRRQETNALGLVYCSPGEFLMGSTKSDDAAHDDEKPARFVRLTKGFWIGKYEVTRAEWERVMETRPWEGNTAATGGPQTPATHVSWNDAVAFCEKLTDSERRAGRLPYGARYALPTEAQWEYACRAGAKKEVWCYGSDPSRLIEFAWWSNQYGASNQIPHAQQVGTKRPNAWGVYDLHGNVLEWCADRYQSQYYKNAPYKDPKGPITGKHRVLRGGAWNLPRSFTRCANRNGDSPDLRSEGVGFRVIRTK